MSEPFTVIMTQLPQVKHLRMLDEWDKLTPKMRGLILFVSDYLYVKFRYIPIWTEFIRNQDMQDWYYKDRIEKGAYIIEAGQKHYSTTGKEKTLSVHQFGRGADMSLRIYRVADGYCDLSDKEATDLVETTNRLYPYGKEPFSTCVLHQIVGKPHLHFQSLV